MSSARTFWILTRHGGSLALLIALAGCKQIAGIEERKFVDGGTQDASVEIENPTEQECDEYCGLVAEGCSAETSGVLAYRADYCKTLCSKLPKAADPSDNKAGHSFECRLDQAKSAALLKNDPGEGAANCKRAGAGGDGTCGSNCEAYCQLFKDICSDTPTKPRENCLEECSKLRDDDSTDADFSFANNIDTIQCRLTHLGAASLAAPEDHCEHAAIYLDKYGPCMSANPRCEDFCAFTMNVCNDEGGEDLRQYESLQECMNTCTKGYTNSVPLLEGQTQDKDQDTVACRRYHVYNALLIDKIHCNHAGPGGDGHCGPICANYCKLVKAACTEGFDAEYESDQQCRDECREKYFPNVTDETKQADIDYNVGMAQRGDTIQCRLFHTSLAFTRRTECTAALGGDVCSP